ncbi:MAG: hypothetical protein ABT15_05440 [Pseudonocardia sp. SCN 73-27]|nr:MAG: hypothetical protein ABS80_00960 [Pseudonocardia sp. SCN 72-51]ODV08226.1 MAG: hypothetical protein ABT15_05440 [Pseudonocardia sp. SCN 73-27]
MRVGFVGLGNQGAPMARALSEAGFDLRVWARRPAAYDQLSGAKYTACRTIAELARGREYVGLCARDDGDVEELLAAGLLAHLPAGSVVVNHATGAPDAARRFEEAGRPFGVAVIDAPVSGGREAAIEKALTTMVGGDHDAVARARPALETFSARIHHLGPAGLGQLAKLLNNTLYLANLRNAEEMVAVAAQLGFDPEEIVPLIQASSGSSYALHALTGMMTVENVVHYQDMMDKDLGHFRDAVRSMGVADPPLLERAEHGLAGIPEAVRRMAAAHD